MRPLQVSFEDIRDIFVTMQFEQMSGIALSDTVEGDAKQVGSDILAVMGKYVRLIQSCTVASSST